MPAGVEWGELMNQRIQILSFLWMIGIVLFHSGSNGCSAFYRELTTDFRVGGVSFFFVVSGYFLMKHFQGDIYSWWKESILKRLKTLMIPYVVWCTLGLTGANVLSQYGLISLGPIANPPLWYVKFLFVFCLISPLIILFVRKLRSPILIPAIVVVNLIVPCIPLPLKFSLVHSLLMFSVGIAIALNTSEERKPLNIEKIQAVCYLAWGIGLLIRTFVPELPMQVKWMLNVYSSLFLVLGLWISSGYLTLRRIPSWVNLTFFIYCSHGILLRHIHI